MTEKDEAHADHLSDLGDVKESHNKRDVDLGQMLEVHATEKEERKVLLKLDFMYLPRGP